MKAIFLFSYFVTTVFFSNGQVSSHVKSTNHKSTLNTYSLFEKGVEKLNSGDTILGFYFLDSAISIEPNNYEFRIKRGDILCQHKNYSSAIKDFNKALKLDASRIDGYYYRSQLYFFINHYDSALVDINMAIKIDTTDNLSYLLKGEIEMNSNDAIGAIFDFTKCLSFDSTCCSAFIKRGSLNYIMGKLDESFADFTKASKLDCEFAKSLLEEYFNEDDN